MSCSKKHHSKKHHSHSCPPHPYPPHPCPPHPCPPVPTPCGKTIALLELTGNGVVDFDNQLKITFEYYFEDTELFEPFQIVNTDSDLNYTIKLLNYYYNIGYRIFIGFSRSSILSGVLSWFQARPDAIGISPQSTSPALNIPKNIYRLTPSDDLVLQTIKINEYILTRTNIYYIYSEGESATTLVLNALQADAIIGPKLKAYPVNADSSNLTESQLQTFFEGATAENDACILYLFDSQQRKTYIDLFNYDFTPIPNYDISLQSYPIFNSLGEIIWNSLYSSWVNINVSTSTLWRKGQSTLREEYNVVAMNVLQLNQNLVDKIGVSNISNFAFVQQFDTTTKDTLYFSLSLFRYVDLEWIPSFLYIKDPIFGIILYDITS